ncbi:hypothetical protein [Roseivivax sp. THAF197b]|uniref:hypothetical protein n=1 Tax=Roseivivax sp. THAF197b TaxID=2588299 RepID=UPI001269641E|nr:hypothetical protein [Roseivivax sp. THAF197b]QFS82354.1 hypothetical protein FIV09_05900 [Roseivivax sp. THAF197b]
MNAREFFTSALETFVQEPTANNALELYRACGAVWNVGARLPDFYLPDVAAIVKSQADFRQWQVNGQTYAGAAHRIRPLLVEEFQLPVK